MGDKYFSEMEGYTDNFIEVTDSWTVKEMRALADSEEPEYLEIFHKKVEAMFLKDVDGKEFTNPRTLAKEDLENFDVAMGGFIGTALPMHVRKRRNLGGMNVRLSSPSKDGPVSPTVK